jgi:transposase
VRSARLWAGLLGLVKVGVEGVEGVEFDEAEQAVVVSVRPRKATKRRCGRCGERCPGYDQGAGRTRRCGAIDRRTSASSRPWRRAPKMTTSALA